MSLKLFSQSAFNVTDKFHYLAAVSFILNIDTAVQSASVCISKDDKVLGMKLNPSQKDHAAWLHLAIKELLSEQQLSLQQIDAIAISAGPGSYTGLRVGMSTAKGLCYALNIPLIKINTLQMMAAAAKKDSAELLCPMIDARRMEVFTAVFDHNLQEVLPSTNLILDEGSLKHLLDQLTICFFGNGSTKFQSITKHPNASFKTIEATAQDMAELSYHRFSLREFADVAYSEPFYGKDFHSPTK
jgi:tRNA threonylcarbamoyladenosine biosynthesis protein TsaB